MDIGTRVGAVCGFVATVFLLVSLACSPRHSDERTRIPNFSENGQELADLKQQLADTQTAAKQAQQAAKDATQARDDMQKQLQQLVDDAKKLENQPSKPTAQQNTYSCQEPDVKCGPNEKTNPGIITDFGMVNISETTSTDNYITFTFTDRTGFTKKFAPVCPGQTIKTGVPITLLYHWRNWIENIEGKRGCFWIDGFQQ